MLDVWYRLNLLRLQCCDRYSSRKDLTFSSHFFKLHFFFIEVAKLLHQIGRVDNTICQKPKAALLNLTIRLAKIGIKRVANLQSMLKNSFNLTFKQTFHCCATVVVLLVVLVSKRNSQKKVFLARFLELSDYSIGFVERQLQNFEKRWCYNYSVSLVKTV